MAQLLKDKDIFVKYMVTEKVNQHHDGEREVYRAYDTQRDKEFALIVYNLGCKRYESEGIARKKVPDFIDEVAFLRNCSDLSVGFAKVVDCGIEKVGNIRLGWMLQQNINANITVR